MRCGAKVFFLGSRAEKNQLMSRPSTVRFYQYTKTANSKSNVSNQMYRRKPFWEQMFKGKQVKFISIVKFSCISFHNELHQNFKPTAYCCIVQYGHNT